MRLLFIADGRSPISLSWIRHWIETGHQTHLVSTYPCTPPAGLASFTIIPVAFGGMSNSQKHHHKNTFRMGGIYRHYRNFLQPLRYVLGPIFLHPYQKHLRSLVETIRPDLVHALRIPFEGMLSSTTPKGIPLVVSIWGNDLTLHARGSILMAHFTRHTLSRANGLIADASRDIRLGIEWGFESQKPTLVVPGAGGIRFHEMESSAINGTLPGILPEVPIIVNPRGQRPGSLRQDVFFQSIPLVLEKIPQSLFVCPQLAGDHESEYWVKSLGIQANTILWPHLDTAAIWVLYKKSRVYVSPSLHDGTPNSLLEAMACGCFPVVGEIESMREWIETGVNGLLVDATSPQSLANGIISALQNPALWETAKIQNARIVAERAEYGRCMKMTEAFYQKVGRGDF